MYQKFRVHSWMVEEAWFESLLVHSGVSSATRRKATGADKKKRMVEEALGGRLKPRIAKKPEPHMLNFEDVPGESVPILMTKCRVMA